MEAGYIPTGIIFGALRSLKNFLSMSISQFDTPYDAASESYLSHLHLPVKIVKNWLGTDAIPGVEPWVAIMDGNKTQWLKLLWRNENDAAGPVPTLDLRAGRIYHIPLVARSIKGGVSLRGGPATDIRNYQDYYACVLRAGIPRITDGHHYYTHHDLTNLENPGVYSIRIELRVASGKSILNGKYHLFVPGFDEPNDKFRLQIDD